MDSGQKAEIDAVLGIPESLRGFGTLPAPAGALGKVRYTHDAMIDLIIASPWISQNEIAAHFGYSVGWISQIFTSDVFQARLAERKDELVDPTIRATIEENFKALCQQSMTILRKKLEGNPSDDLLLGTLNIASKALGYGARQAPTINQQFVVQVPGKVGSSAEWAEIHRPEVGSAGSKAVGHGPVGIPGRAIPEVADAEIVTAASPRPPAPPLPDGDKLLQELVGG